MIVMIRINSFGIRSSALIQRVTKGVRSMKIQFTKNDQLELDVHSKIKALPDLASNPRILLSVSGGSDSMAMLHLFASLRSRHQMRLEVMNFNHRIRKESCEEVFIVVFLCILLIF